MLNNLFGWHKDNKSADKAKEKTVISEFIGWLKDNKWNVLPNEEKINIDSNEVLRNFKNLPLNWKNLAEQYSIIENEGQTVCFLCADDYNAKPDGEFQWNEFETISLNAAIGDEKWAEEIKKWWSDKLPIVMSVRNGYSFYAIDTGKGNGAIIRGQEPEFEDAKVVAEDFDSFLKKVIGGDIEL